MRLAGWRSNGSTQPWFWQGVVQHGCRILSSLKRERGNTVNKLVKSGLPLLLALAAAASPAMARDHDRGHGSGQRHGQSAYQDRGNRDNSYSGGNYQRDGRGYGHDRGDSYRGENYRYVAPRPTYGRGYSYRPSYRQAYQPQRWARGARYYGPGYGATYIVSDYGYYGLRHPPYGYGWRRDDRGDFLLVALATGIIADLVLHGGY